MATLDDNIIIYDDSCPMCQMYTQGFVKLDILKSEHRMGFSAVPDHLANEIDLDRSRHEIPLYNRATG